MGARRVLIDAFNSGAAQPRGIGTYARTLAQANHLIGNEVVVLTGGRAGAEKNAEAGSYENVANELFPYTETPWYVKNRLYSIRRLMGRTSSADISPIRLPREMSRIDQRPLLERLGYFDKIMNSFE